MRSKKNLYRLMDAKGRILIPRHIRDISSIDCGDIVRLDIINDGLSIRKVELIEARDHTPEALEAYVRAAIKAMSDEKRLSILAELSFLLNTRKETVG